MYTIDDLSIINDPLKWVQDRKERFLWLNNDGLQLAINIVNDAMILTNGPVTILQKNNWWIIGSKIDWIKKDSLFPEEVIFSKVIPFPEVGQNSIRGEILLNALAQDVITITDNHTSIIKGKMEIDDDFLSLIKNNYSWKRLIAFRM